MSAVIDAKRARLSDEEFFAMVEAGVFGRRRVFLWDGRLFEKMAKTNVHAFVAGTLSDALTKLVPEGWLIRYENPVRLDERHVPLPDMVVVRGPWERYRDERPQPHDLGLLVEVAVTSLVKDLVERAAKYAEAGVSTYWVADARNRRIIEHRGPRIEDGVSSYQTVCHHGPGDQIDIILDGTVAGSIAVSDLF